MLYHGGHWWSHAAAVLRSDLGRTRGGCNRFSLHICPRFQAIGLLLSGSVSGLCFLHFKRQNLGNVAGLGVPLGLHCMKHLCAERVEILPCLLGLIQLEGSEGQGSISDPHQKAVRKVELCLLWLQPPPVCKPHRDVAE